MSTGKKVGISELKSLHAKQMSMYSQMELTVFSEKIILTMILMKNRKRNHTIMDMEDSLNFLKFKLMRASLNPEWIKWLKLKRNSFV